MSLLKELDQIIRLASYKHSAPNGAPIFKTSARLLEFKRFHKVRD